MDKTKEAFFELVSEYKTLETDTYKVYEFETKDLDGIKWFLEMLWSISKIFDVRFVVEMDKIKVFLRVDSERWRMF